MDLKARKRKKIELCAACFFRKRAVPVEPYGVTTKSIWKKNE